MSLQTDILLPVTTAGLLYPALYQLISQIAMPFLVARQFYQEYALTAGNSISFPKQSGSPGAVVNEVAEGAIFPMDVTAYSAVVVTPKKYGQGFMISKETIEDSLLPVQQDQIARLSMRVANKIDQVCVTTLQSGRSGSVTASGKSLGTDGTEFVMSGSGGPGLGTYDIIDACALVENNNYIPDSILVHPRAKKFIERLPGFTHYSYYGSPIMQEGMRAVPGKFGDILGLDAFSSTNCGTGSAYLVARGRVPNVQAQYSPLGYFVVRRPLTTAIDPTPSRDAVSIYVSTRFGVTVLRGEAACEVTGINVT